MDYDVFCDESRYLEHDRYQYMLIGGVWCERDSRRKINSEIEEIKSKSRFAGELKWNNVTLKKLGFFKKIIRLFFKNKSLSFRCIVIDKRKLKHDFFNPTGGHDEFFYKMYYYMLNKKIYPTNTYRIFLDFKGKNNSKKINSLQEIIGHTYYDFSNEIVTLMQSVQSIQFPVLQLTDFLIGAIGYEWNDLDTSVAKLEICKYLKEKACLNSLKLTTAYKEDKFEVFKINLK